MDEEVVNRFPIPFTHTTPIQNQNLLFPKIINIQNIPQSYGPHKKKKNNCRGDLRLPNSLPRERLIETISQHLVIGMNSKPLPLAGSQHILLSPTPFKEAP